MYVIGSQVINIVIHMSYTLTTDRREGDSYPHFIHTCNTSPCQTISRTCVEVIRKKIKQTCQTILQDF